jgi:hypothetical protein
VRRQPVPLAWTDTRVIRPLTGSFAPLPPGPKPTSVVVLAPPGDPDLSDYDSRFESTHRPSDLPWGAGDALQWLTDHNPKADQVETIDRLVPIQDHGDRLTLLRSPGAAAAFGPGDRTAPGT